MTTPSMARRAFPAAAAALTALAGALAACRPAQPPSISADIVGLMSGPSAGFARATGPRPIVFPDDEGPHPAYQTEWWYYTGHLFVRAGGAAAPPGGSQVASGDAPGPWILERDARARRRFGFQLTFFRSSLAPPLTPAAPGGAAAPVRAATAPASDWSTTQAYLAHFTVTDVDARRFRSAERLNRGAVGLAGAVADPFRVWLGPWSAAARAGRGARGGHGAESGVRLLAGDGPVAVDVTVRPAKAAALHGQAGWSRKGPDVGNASYYFSFPRLVATGVVTTADGTWPVEGGVWMDHEWSTSALAEGRVGWDWLSLQLDDGRDVMAFQIRDADGQAAPESSGSVVDAAGRVTPLAATDFSLAAQGTWTSPRSAARYPSGWRLGIPGAGYDLRLTPLLDDQELSTGFRYWEGAVTVDGTADGRPVAGRGYVELTGYQGAPQGAPQTATEHQRVP